MDGIDTSGKALVEHWKWAADKGLMNTNTASALQSACAQVLGVVEGWETADVRSLDIEEIWRRFLNRRGKDFTPKSLETYRSRFTRARDLFLTHAENPTSGSAFGRQRATRRSRPGSTDLPEEHEAAVPLRMSAGGNPSGSLVEYPFPIREGRFAFLKLPPDLKASEVRRLTAYLMTLTVDADPGVA